MPRPGVDVSLLNVPGTVSVETDSGVWFVVGQTERGPTGPRRITSLNDYANIFGARVSYSVLYDALETYFREGGAVAWISRVVGPAATTGTVNLLDSGAAVSLVAKSDGPGAWSSSYKIQVLAGSATGLFVIRILDTNNVVLEDSGDLPTNDAAVAWSNYSNYVTLTLGASANNPAVAAAVAFPAGNDDRNNITDAQWQTALDAFGTTLGPGQVSEPGRTTTTAFTQLTGHAETHNRVALLDMPNVPTAATLIAITNKSRFAAKFAPWVVVPGLTFGTIRTVPPSALIAGLCARNDASFGANTPSAGNNGVSLFATDLSQPDWNDTDRASLNNAGVNVIRRYLGIRNYGWRSAADPVADKNWLPFNNSRLYIALTAELNAVGENYVFAEVDGINGSAINGLHGACAGVMKEHYDLGELFGDQPDEAFVVDTGSEVNTPTTIANLELHAIVYTRMAPFGEWVQIQISKRPVTESL